MFHPPIMPTIPGQAPIPYIAYGLPIGAIIPFAGDVDIISSDQNSSWEAKSSNSIACGPASSSQDVEEPEATSVLPKNALEQRGWMVCDGRSLLKSKHNHLFRVIGTIYGTGSSKNSFNLPDYRGLFLRGVDSDAKMDSGNRTKPKNGQGSSKGVGSQQCDALQTHQHTYSEVSETGETPLAEPPGSVGGVTALTSPPTNSLANNTAVRIAHETRPKNVAVHYLIKYTHQYDLLANQPR